MSFRTVSVRIPLSTLRSISVMRRWVRMIDDDLDRHDLFLFIFFMIVGVKQ